MSHVQSCFFANYIYCCLLFFYPPRCAHRFLKPGFHMIATIAVIAEKKKAAIPAIIWKPDFPTIVAIAATMIAEIEKVLSPQSLSLRSLWLESGSIWSLWSLWSLNFFLLSDRNDRSDYVETRLKYYTILYWRVNYKIKTASLLALAKSTF